MVLQRTTVQIATAFYSAIMEWKRNILVSISTSYTFHTSEICQEPLGKEDGNDYAVLLIFQMSRERRKVWMYYYVLLVHFIAA